MSLAQVRLTVQERQAIRNAVEKAAAGAGIRWRRISLFGSRTDPEARGGDIDLYIEVFPSPSGEGDRFPTLLRLALEDELGDRKVDLVIDDGRKDLGPFGEIVRQTKVDLWTAL